MNLSNEQMLKAIDAGLHLHEAMVTPSNKSYGAENYLAAGFCQIQVERGMRFFESLSEADRDAISNFTAPLYGVEVEVKADTYQIGDFVFTLWNDLVENTLTVEFEGQDLIVVRGGGNDRHYSVALCKNFIAQGETMITHALVEGQKRYLMKLWSPNQLIKAVIGLAVHDFWGEF